MTAKLKDIFNTKMKVLERELQKKTKEKDDNAAPAPRPTAPPATVTFPAQTHVAPALTTVTFPAPSHVAPPPATVAFPAPSHVVPTPTTVAFPAPSHVAPSHPTVAFPAPSHVAPVPTTTTAPSREFRSSFYPAAPSRQFMTPSPASDPFPTSGKHVSRQPSRGAVTTTTTNDFGQPSWTLRVSKAPRNPPTTAEVRRHCSSGAKTPPLR